MSEEGVAPTINTALSTRQAKVDDRHVVTSAGQTASGRFNVPVLAPV